ncbi:hypothetical protein GCM10028803_36740 [Larkinella knui]|uniref:Uncharacterized protein n=1 Tax=Larkinella knui TaxID=2025310 RepID=A0A3P1CE78_9BACT|nr:hypothetical protein [Larkinella knui]RRB11530.1 hypothetical protein EHT87_23955 [Larkinella knui]
MKDYIVVHYDGNSTNLTYTDSEQDARAYLAALITTNQVGKNDTLSIVRVCDDYLVYFKRRNNSLKTVLGKNAQTSVSWSEFWFGSAQELLKNLYKKLTTLGVASGSR